MAGFAAGEEFYDRKDIYELIDKCDRFSWSVFKRSEFPYRHVGIVISFDGRRRFTINVRPVDGSKKGKLGCVTGNAMADRSIEGVPQTDVKFFDPVQEIDISTPIGMSLAWTIVDEWLDWKGSYNLKHNNCRDDTERCMKAACRINPCYNKEVVKEIGQEFSETRDADESLFNAARGFLGRVFEYVVPRQ